MHADGFKGEKRMKKVKNYLVSDEELDMEKDMISIVKRYTMSDAMALYDNIKELAALVGEDAVSDELLTRTVREVKSSLKVNNTVHIWYSSTLPENIRGRQGRNNIIINNKYSFTNVTAINIIRHVVTIAHEYRHAWQRENNFDFSTYYGGEVSTDKYMRQFIEYDARTYALKFVRKSGIIKKLVDFTSQWLDEIYRESSSKKLVMFDEFFE